MTKDHSDAHHARPAETEHPAPVETIAKAPQTSPVEEPPVEALQIAPSITREDDSPAAAAAFSEPFGEPFGMTAGFFFDTRPLAQKSLEIWEENLDAVMAHVESLSGVKSFEEAVALQTRFATERFESFGRQSRDLVALAQQLAGIGVAPLCDTRAAA